MKVESCWILRGKVEPDLWWGSLIHQGEGTPVSVEFDYNKVYEIEDEDKSCIGFLHTHPTFTATPSMRDHATMDAWVKCLGKDLICAIIGTDGLRAFVYSRDKKPYEFHRVERLGSSHLVGLMYAFDYQNRHENDDAEIGGLGQPAYKKLPLPIDMTPPDDPEDDGNVISQRLEDLAITDELECPQGHGMVKASEGYKCLKCGWNAILFA